MFLRSSSRPQPVECFFCLSTTLLAPDHASTSDRKGKGKATATGVGAVGSKWNWHCERCGCWNVRDERGEMVSELPAMRTPTMNQESFSLRAKPSSSHLPTAPGASPFCHVCLTNQTLIMNMLANYLPDEDDPTYRGLYESLPAYLASVHARYPPVCHNCQPAVDEALRRADRRANVDAWGSALRRSHTPGSNRRSQWYEWFDVAFWRFRGAMFCCSTAVSLGLGLIGAIAPEHLDSIASAREQGITTPTLLVLFNVLSISWIAWDPYWLRRKTSRSNARVTGRSIWLIDMALIYCLRLVTSLWTVRGDSPAASRRNVYLATTLLEVTILLHALTSLRFSGPVAVRPIQPVAIKSATASPDATRHENAPRATTREMESDHQGINPMFGQPAFAPKSSNTDGHGEAVDEVMDWEPSPVARGDRPRRPPGLEEGDHDSYLDTPSKNDWDTFAVNRQRMFPTQSHRDETGLESLIAGWGLGGPRPDDSGHGSQTLQRPNDPTPTLSHTKIASMIVRTASCLLAVFRLTALAFVLHSDTPQDHRSMIDTITSSIEIGVILATFLLPAPARHPAPVRTGFLAMELVMRYIYLVARQRPSGSFRDSLSVPWALGLTWGQWAIMNLTRAML